MNRIDRMNLHPDHPVSETRVQNRHTAGEELIMAIADTATEQMQDLLPVTRTIIEGPYFRIGAPERNSLIEEGITGDRMLLTGQVLTPEGKPIPGAVLNFWMSDDEGNYDM